MLTSTQSLVIALFLLFFLYTEEGRGGLLGEESVIKTFCRSVFLHLQLPHVRCDLCSLEDKSGNLYLQIYNCIS